MPNVNPLFRIRNRAKNYSMLSEQILRKFIRKHPGLLYEFNSWLYERRMIDPAIFLGESLCDLENCVFEDKSFLISVFVGAAGAIADDLIDKGAFEDIDQVGLLIDQSSRPPQNSKRMELFYIFDLELQQIIPVGFKQRNNELIVRYNRAQIDSRKLFYPSVTKEEVIDIRNRVGGYTIISLHRLLFPNKIISIEDIDEDYKPLELLPSSKSQALYNYGAWTNRVDDLWDEEKDRKIGMKQLAIEGCISWDDLPKETKKVFNDLSLFYPVDVVEKVFEKYFAPLVDKSIEERYNR
jgi:hypothetical protein